MIDLQPLCRGTVEPGVKTIGIVVIEEGTIIRKGTMIRGPVVIGKNCDIGPTYVGSYTSIGDNCVIRGGEIESTIIIGDSTVHVESDIRIVDSVIGRHTTIRSAKERLPSGFKLILGENSELQI